MIACIASGVPVVLARDAHPACDQGAVVDAVSAERAAFNDAIRDGDLAIVERVLVDDVVLVAGTHSDLFVGKDAQLDLWRREFSGSTDRLIYVRTPNCIRTSPVRPIALERGTWRGESPAGDFAAGSYSAKWRRIDGSWMLEAELFMTETCGGSACP
ncbi:nuclear transport factor 2 family protein [Wenzhouxiangella sp. XN79A]|nr:nuclear transport factor 2 family protein [Wenzhouxiangella sp. XN79A]